MIKKWLVKARQLIFQTYVGYKVYNLKKEADFVSSKFGVQIFIIKYEREIISVTKDWFTYQKQHGKFPKDFTCEDLKKIAFYYTKK